MSTRDPAPPPLKRYEDALRFHNILLYVLENKTYGCWFPGMPLHYVAQPDTCRSCNRREFVMLYYLEYEATYATWQRIRSEVGRWVLDDPLRNGDIPQPLRRESASGSIWGLGSVGAHPSEVAVDRQRSREKNLEKLLDRFSTNGIL